MAGCTDKLAARMNLSFLKPPPSFSDIWRDTYWNMLLLSLCVLWKSWGEGLAVRGFPHPLKPHHFRPVLPWDHLALVRFFPPATRVRHQLDVPTRPLRLMFPNQAALWVQWKELSHCVISFKQMIMMGHVGLSGISRHNMITWAVKTSLRRQWLSPTEEGPVLVSHDPFGLRPFGPFFACLV